MVVYAILVEGKTCGPSRRLKVSTNPYISPQDAFRQGRVPSLKKEDLALLGRWHSRADSANYILWAKFSQLPVFLGLTAKSDFYIF